MIGGLIDGIAVRFPVVAMQFQVIKLSDLSIQGKVSVFITKTVPN